MNSAAHIEWGYRISSVVYIMHACIQSIPVHVHCTHIASGQDFVTYYVQGSHVHNIASGIWH